MVKAVVASTSPQPSVKPVKRKPESPAAPSPKKGKLELLKPVEGMEGVSIVVNHLNSLTLENLLKVFLCIAPAMDDDGEMIYNGYVMAVKPDHYLKKMAEKHGQQIVSVYVKDREGQKQHHLLPLVYPKPADVQHCQKITEAPLTARRCNIQKKPGSEQQRTSSSSTTNVSLSPSKHQNSKITIRSPPRVAAGGKMKLTTTIYADRPLELDVIRKTLHASGLAMYDIGQVIIKNDDNNKFVHSVPLTARKPVTVPILPKGPTSQPIAASNNSKSSPGIVVKTDTMSADLKVSPIKYAKTYGKSEGAGNKESDSLSNINLPIVVHGHTNIITIPDNVPPQLSEKPKSNPLAPVKPEPETKSLLIQVPSKKEPVQTPDQSADPPQEQPAVPPSNGNTNKRTLTDYFKTVGTRKKSKPTTATVDLKVAPTGGKSILKSKQPKQEVAKEKPTSSRTSGKRIQACGDCEACHAPNCEVCIYCRDMKKYGGSGRLKQKCLQRLCRRVTSSTLHKQAERSGIITPRGQKKLKGFIKKHSGRDGDQPWTSDGASDDESAGGERIYQGVIRAEYLSLKKIPNCGSCASCRSVKKSMCLKKKCRIQSTIARLEKQQLDAKAATDSPEKAAADEIKTEPTSGSVRPTRVRKPTQKLCESMSQTSSTYGWTGKKIVTSHVFSGEL